MCSTQRVRVWMLVPCALTCAVPAAAGPAVPPSPLPVTGNVVHVNTVQQLQAAVASIASNTTILIAPGTYQLTSPLYVNGSFTNVAIRGASANRDDVVLVGRGMTVDGGVPFDFHVARIDRNRRGRQHLYRLSARDRVGPGRAYAQ